MTSFTVAIVEPSPTTLHQSLPSVQSFLALFQTPWAMPATSINHMSGLSNVQGQRPVEGASDRGRGVRSPPSAQTHSGFQVRGKRRFGFAGCSSGQPARRLPEGGFFKLGSVLRGGLVFRNFGSRKEWIPEQVGDDVRRGGSSFSLACRCSVKRIPGGQRQVSPRSLQHE